jgi:flavin-dependent dehydrogenase
MRGFDVVVVGAGLAGLECARGLAERGARVLVAERQRTIGRTIRTTGIFVRRTLEDFPLPEDCLGPPVRRVVLHSPGGRTLDLSSDLDEFRLGDVRRLLLRRTEACLRLGVTFLPGHRFLGSTPLPRGSRVLLHAAGRPVGVCTRFLVGADGVGSGVAADLGLDRNREWIVGLEEVYEDPREKGPALHCFLDPVLAPGYIAWVACDGESAHVGVGGDPLRFDPRESLSAFAAGIRDRFLSAGARPSERRGGRIPVGGVLRRIASARGLLVGDAAGAVSPLTAGGLDACLRLSAYAARVMAESLEGDPQRLERAYRGSRFRTRLVSRLWMRRLFAGLSSAPLLEAGFALLRAAPLQPLARHVFFGRGSFPIRREALLPLPASRGPCGS